MDWKCNSSEKAQQVLSKMSELLDFCKGLPESKQSGWGTQGANKSYETLLSHMDDPSIPVKLRFLEEIAFNPNEFSARSQTSAPIVPFLVNYLENVIQNFTENLILSDVLKKANNTYKLSQIYITD